MHCLPFFKFKLQTALKKQKRFSWALGSLISTSHSRKIAPARASADKKSASAAISGERERWFLGLLVESSLLLIREYDL